MVPSKAGSRAPAFIILMGLFLTSCTAGGHPEGGEAGDLQAGPVEDLADLAGAYRVRVAFPGGRVFLAEVADTPEGRARGLMYRDRLEPGTGMFFIFEEPGPYSFWMKNTRIPLDIVWLDRQGRVVHVERQVPPCVEDPCPTYSPRSPAIGVLEVRGGQADGLRAGERLLLAAEAAPLEP
ncbi:MAG: DUF192 domain-containing protein [Acidobacteria bacterium]|nr:DUF192 domain-containing protein [Acidobacteriota bacterium]